MCNYLAGELVVVTIPTSSSRSSSTVSSGGKSWYYYDYQVSDFLVAHPIIFIATDAVPTDGQASVWNALEMITYTSNNYKYLRFLAQTKPSTSITVGVKGVVPV